MQDAFGVQKALRVPRLPFLKPKPKPKMSVEGFDSMMADWGKTTTTSRPRSWEVPKTRPAENIPAPEKINAATQRERDLRYAKETRPRRAWAIGRHIND